MVTSFDKEVECIMAKREVRRKGVPRYFEYFVKWKGLPKSEGNWEEEVFVEVQRHHRSIRIRRIYHGDEDVTGLGGEECHGPHVQGPTRWIDHARPLSPHVQIHCTVVGRLQLVTVVGRCW
ncbi:unnamed protein product [Prunus armeniaca]